jgi:hypothetical protein
MLLGVPAETLAHGSCTALRMKGAGKRCQMISRCHVRDAEGREPVSSCVAAQLVRLERQFKRSLLHKDCHPYGEPADVVAILDGAAGTLAQQLALDGGRCASAKLLAAGKACLVLLRSCHAGAERTETPVDPTCVEDAAATMRAAFDKAERRYPCTTVDDHAAARAVVEQAAEDVVTELAVAP